MANEISLTNEELKAMKMTCKHSLSCFSSYDHVSKEEVFCCPLCDLQAMENEI